MRLAGRVMGGRDRFVGLGLVRPSVVDLNRLDRVSIIRCPREVPARPVGAIGEKV